MRKAFYFAVALAVTLLSLPALAATISIDSFDFTLPTNGGPVDSIEVLIDGAPAGTIATTGGSIPAAFPGPGTYDVQLRFINAAGSSFSNTLTRNIGQLMAPGDDGTLNDIELSCDDTGCILTIT